MKHEPCVARPYNQEEGIENFLNLSEGRAKELHISPIFYWLRAIGFRKNILYFSDPKIQSI